MEWREIEGFEGLYQINSDATVRSLPRLIINCKGYTRKIKGGELKAKKHSDGYLFVTLSKNGNTKNFYLHRLVASIFLPKSTEKEQVNHIDGIKSNNSISNLEWVSPAENAAHAYNAGLSSNIRGGHKNAQKVANVNTGETYNSILEAAESVKLNYTTLRNMLCGSNRNTSPFQYAA